MQVVFGMSGAIMKDQWIEFANPMAHNSNDTNADGPIIGIEIQNIEGDIVYWSHDADNNLTAYGSLESLCESYGFDLATIAAMVQS
jgi:hypothetical protein